MSLNYEVGNNYNEYNTSSSIPPIITRINLTFQDLSASSFVYADIYVAGHEVPYHGAWRNNNVIVIGDGVIQFPRRSGIEIYEMHGRPYLNLSPLFINIVDDTDFPFADDITFENIVSIFKKELTQKKNDTDILFIDKADGASLDFRPKYIKNAVRSAYNKAINSAFYHNLPRNITKELTTYLNFGGSKKLRKTLKKHRRRRANKTRKQ